MKKYTFILVLSLLPILLRGQSDSLVFYHGELLLKDTISCELFVFCSGQTRAKVLKQSNKYYQVAYKNYVGWISKDKLVTEEQNTKMLEEAKAKKAAEELAAKKAEEKAKRDALLAKQAREKAKLDAFNKRKADLLAKYGSQEIVDKIIAKKIWLTMTDKMAIDSWGNPTHVNRSVGSWGVHEQWVYEGTYLYFENGVLTSWQD